jgi:hypothetical protein
MGGIRQSPTSTTILSEALLRASSACDNAPKTYVNNFGDAALV